MIIYRVQDRSGRGPYRPEFRDWKVPGHDAMNPSIFDEFGWDIMDKFTKGRHHGCGFRELEQLELWFTHHEILKLYEIGFEIVRMEVDSIIVESDRQLLFSRDIPLADNVISLPLCEIAEE